MKMGELLNTVEQTAIAGQMSDQKVEFFWAMVVHRLKNERKGPRMCAVFGDVSSEFALEDMEFDQANICHVGAVFVAINGALGISLQDTEDPADREKCSKVSDRVADVVQLILHPGLPRRTATV